MTKTFGQRWLAIAVLGMALVFPLSARACPSCQAALDQPADQTSDDPMREAKAYAASIYLMAGMPYLLLASVGFLFYRSVKKAQKASASASAPVPNPITVPPVAGTLPT